MVLEKNHPQYKADGNSIAAGLLKKGNTNKC